MAGEYLTLSRANWRQLPDNKVEAFIQNIADREQAPRVSSITFYMAPLDDNAPKVNSSDDVSTFPNVVTKSWNYNTSSQPITFYETDSPFSVPNVARRYAVQYYWERADGFTERKSAHEFTTHVDTGASPRATDDIIQLDAITEAPPESDSPNPNATGVNIYWTHLPETIFRDEFQTITVRVSNNAPRETDGVMTGGGPAQQLQRYAGGGLHQSKNTFTNLTRGQRYYLQIEGFYNPDELFFDPANTTADQLRRKFNWSFVAGSSLPDTPAAGQGLDRDYPQSPPQVTEGVPFVQNVSSIYAETSIINGAAGTPAIVSAVGYLKISTSTDYARDISGDPDVVEAPALIHSRRAIAAEFQNSVVPDTRYIAQIHYTFDNGSTGYTNSGVLQTRAQDETASGDVDDDPQTALANHPATGLPIECYLNNIGGSGAGRKMFAARFTIVPYDASFADTAETGSDTAILVAARNHPDRITIQALPRWRSGGLYESDSYENDRVVSASGASAPTDTIQPDTEYCLVCAVDWKGETNGVHGQYNSHYVFRSAPVVATGDDCEITRFEMRPRGHGSGFRWDVLLRPPTGIGSDVDTVAVFWSPIEAGDFTPNMDARDYDVRAQSPAVPQGDNEYIRANSAGGQYFTDASHFVATAVLTRDDASKQVSESVLLDAETMRQASDPEALAEPPADQDETIIGQRIVENRPDQEVKELFLQGFRTESAGAGAEIESAVGWFVETETTDANTTEDISQMAGAVFAVAIIGNGATRGITASTEQYEDGKYYKAQFHYTLTGGETLITESAFAQTIDADAPTVAQDDTVTTLQNTPNGGGSSWFLTQHNAGTIHGDELEEFSVIICEGVRGTSSISPDLRTVEGHVVVRQAQAVWPQPIPNLYYTTEKAYPFVEGETYSFQSLGKRVSNQQWETLGGVQTYVHPVTVEETPANYQTVSDSFLLQNHPTTNNPDRISVQSVLGPEVEQNIVSATAYLVATFTDDVDLDSDISGDAGVESETCILATDPDRLYAPFHNRNTDTTYKGQIHYEYADGTTGRTRSGKIRTRPDANAPTVAQDDTVETIAGTYYDPSDVEAGFLRLFGAYHEGTTHGDELDTFQFAIVAGGYNGVPDLRTLPDVELINAITITDDAGRAKIGFAYNREPDTVYSFQLIGWREANQQWETLGNVMYARTAPEAPEESPDRDETISPTLAAREFYEPVGGVWNLGANSSLTPAVGAGEQIASATFWYAETTPDDTDLTEQVRYMAGAQSAVASIDRSTNIITASVTESNYTRGAYYKVQFAVQWSGGATGQNRAAVVQTIDPAAPTVAQDDQIITSRSQEWSHEDGRFGQTCFGHYNAGSLHGDEIDTRYMLLASGAGYGGTDLRTAGGFIGQYPVSEASNTAPDFFLTFTNAFHGLERGGQYRYQALGKREANQQWETLGAVMHFTVPAEVPEETPPVHSGVGPATHWRAGFDDLETQTGHRRIIESAFREPQNGGADVDFINVWLAETTPGVVIDNPENEAGAVSYGTVFNSDPETGTRITVVAILREALGHFDSTKTYSVRFVGKRTDGTDLGTFPINMLPAGTTAAQDDTVITAGGSPHPAPSNQSFFGQLIYSNGSIHGDELDTFYIIGVEGDHSGVSDLRSVPNNYVLQTRVPYEETAGEYENFEWTQFHSAHGYRHGELWSIQALGKREVVGEEWETLGEVLTFVYPQTETYQFVSQTTVIQKTPSTPDPQTLFARSYLGVDSDHNVVSGVGYLIELAAGETPPTGDISGDPRAESMAAVIAPAGSQIQAEYADRAVAGKTYAGQIHYAYADGTTGYAEVGVMTARPDANDPTVAQDDTVITGQAAPNQNTTGDGRRYFIASGHNQGSIHGDELELFYVVYVKEADYDNGTDLRTSPNHTEIQTASLGSPDAPVRGQNVYFDYGETYRYQVYGERVSDQQWQAFGEILQITIPEQVGNYQVVQSPPLVHGNTPEFYNVAAVRSSLGPQVAHNVTSGTVYFLETTIGDADSTSDISNLPNVQSTPLTFMNTDQAGYDIVAQGVFETVEYGKFYKGQIHYIYSDGTTGRTDSGFMESYPDPNAPTVAQDDTVTTGSALAYKSDELNRYLFNGVHNQGSIHGDELESLWLVYVPDSDYDAGADLRTSPNSITKAMGQNDTAENVWSTNALLAFGETYRYQVFGKRTTNQPWESLGEIRTVTITSEVSPPDTTTDNFVITPVYGAELSTAYILNTNPDPVTGANGEVPIAISGGEYSFNDADYTSAPGLWNGADRIFIRVTSAADYGTEAQADLTLGDRTRTALVTTRAADRTPENFTGGSASGVARNVFHEFAAFNVSAIDNGTDISASGTEYRLNGGAWTSANGTVNEGDLVQFRLLAADRDSTPTSGTGTIGTETEGFSIITAAGAQVVDSIYIYRGA